MSPFNATVFRIRLLLLAAALGLMGFGGAKHDPQVAVATKPSKAASAPVHKPRVTAKISAFGQTPAFESAL